MALPVDDELLFNVARIIGGEDAINVVKILRDKGEATDDEISQVTEMRLNDVRKALFKLYNHSIVIYNRIRDPNTGWFIFRWKLQPDHIEAYIRSQKMRLLGKFESRLKYEQGHNFYSCGTPGCRRLTFEEAMETIFRCPICGSVLKFFDNSEMKERLSERIKELIEELDKL